MAEGRIVETMFNCELPEPIIQAIQSFLTGKEAARTITLSKSWHRAWLTRPNLDFDESDFSNTNSNAFSVLAKKTIQRYEDSNLKIETFRLFLQNHNYENYELANILIVKALKLCASHLSFELEEELGGYPRQFKFVIAREVFESENLFGLSVKGCRIDIGKDHIVRCCKLESLSLSSVKIENKAVISNIISICPFIRNLSLSNLSEKRWYRLIPVNLPKLHNLKCLVLSSVELDTLFFRDMSSNFPSLRDLTLQNWPDKLFTIDVGTSLRLESLSLHRVHIESHMISKIVLSCPSIEDLSLSYVYGTYPISLPKLHKLKCLTLCGVKLDTLFFDDLSTKFPALIDLTLDKLFERDDPDQEKEEIRISSRSLERLNLLCDESLMFREFKSL